MAPDFGQLRNLSRLKQLDHMGARNVEEVCRLLGGHGLFILDNADVLAGEEQFRCPLDNAS